MQTLNYWFIVKIYEMDGTISSRISVDIIKLGVELGRFSKIK